MKAYFLFKNKKNSELRAHANSKISNIIFLSMKEEPDILSFKSNQDQSQASYKAQYLVSGAYPWYSWLKSIGFPLFPNYPHMQKTKLGRFKPVPIHSYCCPDRHVTFLVSKLCRSLLYKWATFTSVLPWPFTVIRFRYLKTSDTCEVLKYYQLVFPFNIQSVLQVWMCWYHIVMCTILLSHFTLSVFCSVNVLIVATMYTRVQFITETSW